MNFNQFEYIRPDLEQLKVKFETLLSQFENADSYAVQKEIFEQYEDFTSDLFTNAVLCSIRNSINMADEFYSQEQNFWDENSPIISHWQNQFTHLLLKSKFLDNFKKDYPKTYFLLSENATKAFNESIIELLQEENRLVTEYERLLAEAKIEFEGQQYTFAQMGPLLIDQDRMRRKSASEASWRKTEELALAIENIYDQLVHLRDQMAKKLGFKNYIELAYVRMNRFDYNEEMVKTYRQQIVEYVVPIVQKLNKRQAKRLNLDKLYYYDSGIQFKNGNAKPYGTAEEILENGRKMYRQLSEETGEFIDLMIDGQLMDVLARDNKRGGGYMTFLPRYQVPFIFANFNGTSGDVDVLTHEAGHAFQGYQSRHLRPFDIVMPTYESCEIHSMSMEFLTWPYMDLFFKEQADKYRFQHLSAAISFLPYGVLVDHFQHEVYANPDMTPAQRRATWRKLADMYMPELDYEDNEFLASGVRWLRQSHIFSSPFYYIDYTLAQVCAFQFWKRSHVDKDPQTWHDYLAICKVGGSQTFLEIVETGNLQSPFKPNALKETLTAIDKWLASVDDSQL